MHACVCPHTYDHRQKSYVHKLSHIQDYRAYPERHTCTHTIILVYPGYTHTHSTEVTSPSLPVACTRRSSGVRGCTFGRRELAGRTLAGTDWDPSTLWPPVGMSSWRPTHFHLCSGPAGKQGPLTKPPWSVIGYKGGHVGPQEGPPNSWSSKLSLWLSL